MDIGLISQRRRLRQSPPVEDFNWEARFNLSYDGATNDEVAGANVIRPVLDNGNVPTPFVVNSLVDTTGSTLTGISLEITDQNQLKGATNDAAPPSTPDPNLYRHRWWSNNPYSIIFTGLDDSKRYQIQLVNHEPGRSMGDIVTSVYYRMGTEASNRFVISGDSAASTPESYDFDDLEQIRLDEMKSQGGQIKIVITRAGSVNINSLSYFVVREYDVVIDGVQTLREAGTTASPLPFVEYIPADTSTPKPAFIFLHGSGERGNGTTQLPNAMKYGPNWSVAMGTFKEDAYAFSPQIPNTEFWLYEGATNLYNFLDYILLIYNIDPNRVYLIGYSAGGNGIGRYYSQALENRIAASVAISTGLDTYDYVEIAKHPLWLLANRYDNITAFADVETYANGILAQSPTDFKFTVFNDTLHQYGQKIVNKTGMGPMVDSNYDPFDQSIYDWLLSYSLDIPEPVKDYNWQMGINFGRVGSTEEVPNWNNLLLPTGAQSTFSFTDLVDVDGVNRGISIENAGQDINSSVLSAGGLVYPHPHVWLVDWWGSSSSQDMQLKLTGFNDAKVYRFRATGGIASDDISYLEVNSVQSNPSTYPADVVSSDWDSDGYMALDDIVSTNGEITLFVRGSVWRVLSSLQIREYEPD